LKLTDLFYRLAKLTDLVKRHGAKVLGDAVIPFLQIGGPRSVNGGKAAGGNGVLSLICVTLPDNPSQSNVSRSGKGVPDVVEPGLLHHDGPTDTWRTALPRVNN